VVARIKVDALADSMWAKYRSKIQLIQQSLNPGGHIYAIGTGKYFSPQGSTGDTCDTSCFWNVAPSLQSALCVLNVTWAVRQEANKLVDAVNERMRAEIAALGSPNVHFVDTDAQYDGNRFCEPGKDIWGVGDDDVWFLNIMSGMQEQGVWNGPAVVDSARRDVSGWPQELEGGRLAFAREESHLKPRGLTDSFQKAALIHPKEVAHRATSHALMAQLLVDNFRSARNLSVLSRETR